MSAPHKPFKVSQLPAISNISSNDLLLVSDYDNGKCTSRKMTFQQMASYVLSAIKNDIKDIASQAIQQALESLDQHVEDVAKDAVAESAQEIIDQKFDAELKPKVIDILDTLGDDVKDGVITVDGGTSNIA